MAIPVSAATLVLAAKVVSAVPVDLAVAAFPVLAAIQEQVASLVSADLAVAAFLVLVEPLDLAVDQALAASVDTLASQDLVEPLDLAVDQALAVLVDLVDQVFPVTLDPAPAAIVDFLASAVSPDLVDILASRDLVESPDFQASVVFQVIRVSAALAESPDLADDLVLAVSQASQDLVAPAAGLVTVVALV